MTGYIAGQFKNSNNIHQMAQIAVNDALRLLGEKKTGSEEHRLHRECTVVMRSDRTDGIYT